ncbi:MAG: RluA family pseudouridine synthase [Lachnospiraceae bacterium]|nr:RluA family pseudouridine synthase [Lachnospiraceae bacterium]
MLEKSRIKILYEDADIIVCIKPAGIASQGGKGFVRDMTDLLKLHVQKMTGAKGEPYLGIVHRLDQPVGGVMVYAKNAASAAFLSAQVASDEMKKRYYAVLEQCPSETEGTLKDYLLRDGRTNISAVVPEARRREKDVKLAELSYRIIKEAAQVSEYATAQGFTTTLSAIAPQSGMLDMQPDAQADSQRGAQKLYLAEISLKTGRHHQIRVQFSHAGCPLYGDRKYNPATEGRELALFSHYLEFTHPKTKKRMQFDEKPEHGIFAEFFA